MYAIPGRAGFLEHGVYREITDLYRIVSTDSFADPKGNPVPASYYGMHEDWPLELLVTIFLGGRKGSEIYSSSCRDAGWNDERDDTNRIE